ncbi:MAG: alpha-mannosidase [Promethearchaeota archaeon]
MASTNYAAERRGWDPVSISAIDAPKMRRLFRFLRRTRLSCYALLLVKGVLERFAADGFRFKRLNLVAVGQSHLDAAWRWTRKQGILKARATFSKALRHVAEVPGFSFAQPSPAYYQWMKDHFPDVFDGIKRAVRAGRWVLVGGCWVEPDTNVPSGESLVRQRLYGVRFFLREFGKAPEFEFVQDSFGFNWNLPQIFAKSGAKAFVTGKVPFWNDTNKATFPSGILRWKGPDGTVLPTLLIYFGYLLPVIYGKQYPDLYRLLKPGASLEAHYGTPLAEVRAAQSDELLLDTIFGYGLGDGGHGPVELEIAVVEAFRTLYPKRFRYYREGDFLRVFGRHLPRWLTWRDELYLETHRGTYTTHAEVKLANREVEVLLEVCEKLQAMAHALGGRVYDAGGLERSWKLLLFNQFHDILPGSSIPEVYEDATADYEECYRYAREQMGGALQWFGSRLPVPELPRSFVAFNPLSWTRDCVVELNLKDLEGAGEASDPPTARDWRGNPLAVQWCGAGEGRNRRLLALLEGVPPHGFVTFAVGGGGESPALETPLAVEENDESVTLENGFLRVVVDAKTGHVTSVWDETLGREVLGGPANVPLAFEEKVGSDAWNIDPHYLENRVDYPAEADSVEVEERGPVRVSVKVVRRIGRSRLVQRVCLYAKAKFVETVLDADWRDPRHLLKLSFPTAVDAAALNVVTAEIPYAFIDRPVTPRTKLDQARWEYACQSWVDLSEEEWGASLLNNGKYGFSVAGAELRPTVLRSAPYPGCAPETMFVDRNDPRRPEFTDLGEHAGVVFRLLPHEGTWREAGTWRAAAELNYPAFVAPAGGVREAPSPRGYDALLSEGGFRVAANNVQVAVVKLWEDEKAVEGSNAIPIVVRLVEREGVATKTSLHLPVGLELLEASEVNLLELEPRTIAPGGDGRSASVELGPHEIKTLLLVTRRGNFQEN